MVQTIMFTFACIIFRKCILKKIYHIKQEQNNTEHWIKQDDKSQIQPTERTVLKK